MELTYRIVGSDGKEYGPLSLAQLQEWIDDRRVVQTSQVIRSDQSEWKAAEKMDELIWDRGAQGGAQPGGVPTAAVEALGRQLSGGASWFYWIAALSVVNSVSSLSGSDWRFIIGLSITQVIDAIAVVVGNAALVVSIPLNLMVTGGFVACGIYAKRRKKWAFITGMTVFAADGLLSLLFADWLSLGFHAFALFCIWSGFKAARELERLAAPAAQ